MNDARKTHTASGEAGQLTVQHRWPRIRFDEVGITVEPIWLSAFTIRWADIEFISPTPSYERTDAGWRAKPTPDYLRPAKGKDPVQELVDAGILELQIAISDRHALPRWTRMLLGSVYMKALIDADDRPEPKRGVLTLDLKTTRLSPGVGELFDVLSAHSRFDLIVTF